MEDLVNLANQYENVYLIANNPYINRYKFKKIKKNSLIISFNHDYYKFLFNYVKCDRISILRYAQIRKFKYHGLNINHNISSYKKTYFLGGKLSNIFYQRYKGNKGYIPMNNIDEYPSKKSPTSGFYIYYMLNKLLNSNVNLYCFGYTFKKGCNSHHVLFEKIYCYKNKANII